MICYYNNVWLIILLKFNVIKSNITHNKCIKMTTQHIILEIIEDKTDSALTMECITNHSRSVLQRIA